MSGIFTPQVLDALLSPQTQERAQAETYLQSIGATDRVKGFLQVIVSNEQQQRCLLAAVLLRREILKSNDLALLNELSNPLLDCFGSSLSCCRSQVGHCLAALCATISALSPTDGPKVMNLILTKISSVASQDIPSLHLIATLAETVPSVFASGKGTSQSLPPLVQMSMAHLGNQPLEALIKMVVYAAIATAQGNTDAPLALQHQQSPNVDPSSPASELGKACLVPLLSLLTQAHEDLLQPCLQHLVEAAVTCPSLLAGDGQVVELVVKTCLKLAAASQLSSTLRLSALELLSSLCAVADVKRQILRLEPLRNAILDPNGGALYQGAELVAQGVDEDVTSWAAEPASLEDDTGTGWEEDDVAMYAESIMLSLVQSFGISALQIVLPLVERLLGESCWQYQRAALSLLDCCLSAAPVSFVPHMPTATQIALTACQAANVRVQHQALFLVGSLCESTRGNIRQVYGEQILGALHTLIPSPCTKVAAVASMVLVSYCRGGPEDEDSSAVHTHLADLWSALQVPLTRPVVCGNSFDTGVVTVQVRAIGAVACLAQITGEAFVPFYHQVMPGLLACAQQLSGHELAQLKGMALEAATIVGHAIGEDHWSLFVPDAQKIMQAAMPILQQATQQPDSTTFISLDELLSACARIASVLRRDYLPYIDTVLPLLLKRAREPADVSLAEGEENIDSVNPNSVYIDEDGDTKSVMVSMPGRGMAKFTINTTQIQEKSQAARAVYEHAAALEGDFGPYAEECIKAFLPLVTYKFSPEVRSTAAQTLASVFDAACCFGEENTMKIPQQYLAVIANEIAGQMQSEDIGDLETLVAQADALGDTLYAAYRRRSKHESDFVGCFANVTDVAIKCMEMLANCLQRRSATHQILSGPESVQLSEDENSEYEAMLQTEETLLTPLMDSVGYVLKFRREQFLPIFDAKVAPVLGPHLQSGDTRARFAAVCLFDDCIEYCGSAASTQYATSLVNGVLSGLDNSRNGGDEELKRASIYGVAQMARKSPHVLASHLQTVMHELLACVRCSKDEADNLSVLENAVSALASLSLIGNAPFPDNSYVQRDELINIFLTHLPLQDDPDEAKICHAGVCELVEKGDIKTKSAIDNVIRIIGETLALVADGEEVASPDTCSRFAQILMNFQRDIAAEQMQPVFSSLAPEAQCAIHSVIEQYS